MTTAIPIDYFRIDMPGFETGGFTLPRLRLRDRRAAGESSLVALLLLYGADASYTNTAQRGMAPLDYAVELNHAHCVKLLFTSGGARPDATDELLFWKEYVDPTSTRPYYHNLLSGETTWVAPDGYCAMHQAGRAGEVPTATATAVSNPKL